MCLLAGGESVHGHLIGRLGSPDELRPIAVTATLESTYVLEFARGAGVGTALHEAFLSWAQEHNVNEIRVQAYASNTTAVNFYQRRGYLPYTVGLRLVPSD
nr:hypothetical protein [Kibdelosporangium sp. MJ126-NF4]CTQ98753.1 hypothetical protein [Kibdelosporangium sp. MJ126-NF4]